MNSFILRLTVTAALVSQMAWAQTSSDVRDHEKEIERRECASKGITVGSPKVYDDSLLQQMLNRAQAQLMSLQFLDQSGIASRLGSIAGANMQYSSQALSVQGGPAPSVATTANGMTNSTVSTLKAPATSPDVQTTVNQPVTNVVTTSPQTTAPNPTPPAATVSMPTAFSVSASDLLSEQMQLTYEIANLRLLLEGSLTDRAFYDAKKGYTIAKPRATVGFPITISPPKRYKNGVAIVEVEVETSPKQNFEPGAPPALTSLLPREKTYNVAAITDRSTSIGAGFVTQVVGVGGSWVSGRKTYYVVQDQDTLALTFQPEEKSRIGFLWQFRPVLGQPYVKSGLKQTFVQLAFATAKDANPIGKVYVRTYWRKYDRSTGILKGIIKGSLSNDVLSEFPIANFELKQIPAPFDVANLEDLGGGQMLVNLSGRFMSGTSVRVGANTYQDGTPGFSSNYNGMRFVAPIADLATKKVVVVSRDGTEAEPLLQENECPLAIAGHRLRAVDEANTLLEIELKSIPRIHTPSLPGDKPTRSFSLPLLFLIGGKAFGYSDAPLRREGTTLSIVLPTAFLIANPEVVVRPLFFSDEYWNGARLSLTELRPGSQTERMVLLQQQADSADFVLYGSRLTDAFLVNSDDVKPTVFGKGADKDTMRLVSMTQAQIKRYKQIAVQRPGERPTLVAVPAVDFKSDAGLQGLQISAPVGVGADEAVLVGPGLSDVSSVTFNGLPLPFKMAADGKSLTIGGLKASGLTQAAGTQAVVVFTASKNAIKIQVK